MEDSERFKSNMDVFLSQKNENDGSFIDYFESFNETTSTFHESDIRTDWNTALQFKIAFNALINIKASLDENSNISIPPLLDVGSKFSEALSFSHLFHVLYTECRHGSPSGQVYEVPGMNMSLLNSEAQKLDHHIPRNSVAILTSLHAMEHFGLGRYGDNIDYFGDQKALKVFKDIICENGYLLLSVPFSPNNSPRIEFHGQRVYNFKTIESMLQSEGFSICHEWFIFPMGAIRDKHNKPKYPVTSSRDYVLNLPYSGVDEEGIGVYLTISQKKVVQDRK
jgi:hypothetical protein